MSDRPKMLDLFCGAGGAAMGYIRAGFDVTGIDIHPQPRYPGRFIQGDALHYAATHGWRYDAIHASPPCQVHSAITPDRTKHIDLIPHTRWLLASIGAPYVIENVERARRVMRSPIMLCGAAFGLLVYRHRLFESNVLLLAPHHMQHKDKTPRAGHGISPKGFVSITSGGVSNLPDGTSPAQYKNTAMGINWMTQAELTQAIPPAYTEFIGRQLMRFVVQEVAA